jgi:hypothetical protein
MSHTWLPKPDSQHDGDFSHKKDGVDMDEVEFNAIKNYFQIFWLEKNG